MFRISDRHRLRRAGNGALAAAAAILLAVTLVPAPARGAPATAPAECGLRPSGSVQQHAGGWSSCVQVTAKLDRAPRVGEAARLTIEVLGEHDRSGVPVQVDLPAGWRWAEPPSGLPVAPAGTAWGPVLRASGTLDLDAGRSRTMTATVVPERAGYADIRARAGASAPEQGADAVHVTIGTTSSRFGYHDPAADRTAPVPDGTAIVPPKDSLPFRPLAKSKLAEPHSDDTSSRQAAGPSCATGRWTYLDGAAQRPSRNLQVQAWDADNVGDDLLGTTLSDGDGRYRICFDNDDGVFGGGQDVYIRFVADNGQWNVERDEDEPWVFRSTTVNDVGDGKTTDFGTLQPGDANLNRGLRAFDEANEASTWTPGDCWDARDPDCRLLHIRWAPDSQSGTFYCYDDDLQGCDDADNTVRLLADDPNDPVVVVHEIGHGVMDDVYEEQYPVPTNCNPHGVFQATSAVCAWTEGFADWYGTTVNNADVIVGANLETQRWGDGAPTGDTVEGRVAGAMRDIADAANAAPGNGETWDRYTEGAPGKLWETFLAHRSTTFHEFWNQRTADGHDVAPQRALGCLFQNTIDYDFRDPLADGTAANRPQAFTAHNYRIDTDRLFWSVVAVRPDGNDHDLALYDNSAQTQHLITSPAPGDAVDFVAVDSNSGHRPLGDYYPRVTLAGGTGGYAIQYAQGTLAGPSDSITMPASEVVAVRDAQMTAGTPVTVTVTPSNATQDPELFVLESTDAAGTWIQRRAGAAASATGGGPGAAEQLTFTPAATGFHAIVVVNRAGAGTYALQVG